MAEMDATPACKDKGLQNKDLGSSPKPSVVSPIKQYGKVSLGFRGFKLVNSKIKLVKQVDVKTSGLKQPHFDSAINNVHRPTLPPVPSVSPATKISTAEALKQMREKIQHRKRGLELGNTDERSVVPEDDKVIPKTGTILLTAVTNGLQKTKSTSADEIAIDFKEEKSMDIEFKEAKPSKVSPDKTTKEKRSHPSYGHTSRNTEQRKPRERSRSPYRETSKYSSAERSTSGSRRNSTSTSHSRTEVRKHKTSYSHRHSPTSSRKRSSSKDDSRSYSRSHQRHPDKQRPRDSDTKHSRSRNSQHHRRSPKPVASTHLSALSPADANTTSSKPQKNNTVHHEKDCIEAETNRLSESSASEVDATGSHKSGEESEYVLRSACSSLESEGEASIQSNSDKQKDNVERDGLFSKLSNTFSTLDSVGMESTGDEADDVGSIYKAQDVVENNIDPEMNHLLTLSQSKSTNSVSYEENHDRVTRVAPPATLNSLNSSSSPIKHMSDLKTDGSSSLPITESAEPAAPSSDSHTSLTDVLPDPKLLTPVTYTAEETELSSSGTPGSPFEECCSSGSRSPQTPVRDERDPNLNLQQEEPELSSCSSISTTLQANCSLSNTPLHDDKYADEPEPILPSIPPDPALSQNNKQDSKIPELASHLKNVFESILQTDFAAVADKSIVLPKINGIVQKMEETTNNPLHPGFLPKFDVPDGRSGSSPSDELLCWRKTAYINESRDPRLKANRSVKSIDFEQPSSSENVDDLNSAAVSHSRVNNASPCSNKLKLHATTKTPLPAKKSYVQQVQKGNEINLPEQDCTDIDIYSSETNDSTKNLRSPAAVDEDVLAVDLSPQACPLKPLSQNDSSTISLATPSSLAPDEINLGCDEKASDGNDIAALSTESGLLRQDSSGSSPADTDDGLRRSARIRTKKNEKTKTTSRPKLSLSALNVGTNESCSPVENKIAETELASNQNVQFEKTINTMQEEETKKSGDIKISKDLSELDYFKARIRLAEGTDEIPQKFEVLDENLYLTTKKKSRARKEIRRMVCDCALDENFDNAARCGENCLNRLLMIECSSRCEFGADCTNKRFQQRRYAPTEVFKTNFKGWGIRAAGDIEAGQLVMEYCGEVVDQREFTLRSLKYSQSNHAHFYFMALSQDEVIDATYKGNSSRFINHSCDPNAETQKWTVNGRLRVGFFTLRKIPRGEEITFDYQFERYGKVAQKCYCGTAKCRGYLGKAPDDDDDDKKSKVSKKWSNLSSGILEEEPNAQEQSEKERKKSKKKLALFEDNTMEKDISRLLGGLRSSKEVLTLSRLMVRCDTHSQRVMCLQVLKETTSQTRLKTFLQFHGLSIIWSWMVDVSGVGDSEAYILKLDIIETLSKLPINNKNVIEDSKVLSVVQRWAKNGIGEPSVDEESEAHDDKKEKGAKDTPDSDHDQAILNAEVGEKEHSPEIALTNNDSTTETELAKDPTSDEDLKDDSKKPDLIEDETNQKVVTAATSLLNCWKDLREIYRIPKRPKPVGSPDQDSSSRDNSHSRTSSPLPKHGRNEDSEYRSGRHGHSWRGSSPERRRDSSEHTWESDRNWRRERRSDHRESRLSPAYCAHDSRRESARRKRRFSTDSDDQSLNGKHIPWHCKAPQGNRFEARMSRQEYRKKFEKDMQKREQEKKRKVEEKAELSMTPNSQTPVNSRQTPSDMAMMGQEIPLISHDLMTQNMNMMGQNITLGGQVLSSPATFTASGYSGNLIQINPAPQSQIIMQPYVDQGIGQQIGGMPQIMNVMQQTQNSYPMQMYASDPNMQVGLPATYSINNQPIQNQQQMGTMGQQMVTNQVGVIQPQQTIAMQQPSVQQQATVIQTAQQQQQPASNVTILGSQNGQAIVLLTAEQLQKLTQDQPHVQTVQPTASQPAKADHTSAAAQGTVQKASKPNKSVPVSKESAPAESPKSTTSPKLPPNWKIATDPEGRIYYYHMITRQTQWDPPTWDGKEEDMVGKKEAEMDLSSTPTYDERRHKSSKNKVEKITEEGKKAKETFRLKMSQFVVQCLSSFRKTDCRVGRITSTDDFKHLARKLTHNIMLKEIKQVRVWEDLDFNANVRHKTKEYVKKYMSRVGPTYRIRDDNPMDPV